MSQLTSFWQNTVGICAGAMCFVWLRARELELAIASLSSSAAYGADSFRSQAIFYIVWCVCLMDMQFC